MNVCFFRHGIAVPSGTTAIDDDLRPLTDEGRKKTRQGARGLAKLGLKIDTVITSPLPRAVQTAEILCEVLGLARPVISERLLPAATGPQLLDILRETTADAPVLVGHEPSLSDAVGNFITASSNEAIELRKAGLAVARLRTLTPRPRGTLTLLLTPRALRRIR